MSLRHLETLVAIADSGSFRVAATRLGVTQSAVSMQMKALETELGAEVFERDRRPPILSPLGESLVERARDLVNGYEELRLIAAQGHGKVGELRIGTIPTASTSILPDSLSYLRKHHPRLQVRIVSGLSDDLIKRVKDGALDSAIITEPTRLDRSLTRRRILTEKLVVAAPSAHGGANAKELLSSLPFIRFNRKAGIGRIIEQGLKAQRLEPEETMELDSVEAILQMVGHGLGCGVVPQRSLDGPVSKRLYQTPFGQPAIHRKVALVERIKSRNRVLTDALYDALRETTANSATEAPLAVS